ncbi:MAG: redoxin domain-containing protein [Candidatus Micrarchaeaceae archaeon]
MIEIGTKVPEISLFDTDLKKLSLIPEHGKPTLIAFFPGAFTGVCTKELCTFRDSMSKLNNINAKVVAISVDGPFSNKAFKDHNNLKFSILSDYNKEAIKLFGIELNNFAGMHGYTTAKRSVFIADKKGAISYVWISDDPTVEPNYNILLEELKKVA